MPIFRYLVFVGACLTAIMLVLNATLPPAASNLATADQDHSFDRTTIRIAGSEKQIQPVVIDTSLPTIVPAPVSVARASQAAAAGVREARAEISKSDVPKIEPADIPKKKKVASRRKVYAPATPVYQTPHVAGLFGGW